MPKNSLLHRLAHSPSVVPPGIAAVALDVSRTQLYRLIDSGRIETREIDGARWPTIRGLVAYDGQREGRSGAAELHCRPESTVTVRNGGNLSRRQGVVA
jgi:hypothetical protein